ncbi:dsDNA nuclease domain-containing protein [Methylobacterium fujisawaense]|uniref:dsDNA nuclease domain-containing protein n=1 Tax=Methylobacterium fujisawaense TaxID=107400 RepID=UPI003CE88573
MSASSDASIAETGGGHGQKGIEYQRNWAILQMLVLEEAGQPDFIILFEAIQDIAILDSPEFPTRIELNQIKKKDRGEWTWAGLTKLHQPPDPVKQPKSKTKIKSLADVAESPLGKLHAAVHAFNIINSSGRFISNAGCDIVMANNSNAATSLPVALDTLPAHFSNLLTTALATLHKTGSPPPDLAKLTLVKADLPVDDPLTFTVGKTLTFLTKRSPKHAGQAQSFVESLLAKIAPLGAKTSTCSTFEEMKSQHGYSRSDFIAALASLETVVDVDYILNIWLIQLQQEGMSVMDVTAIRVAVTAIYRRQVMGAKLPQETAIEMACNDWLETHTASSKLLTFFEAGLEHLATQFPLSKSAELRAHFALKAIEKCMDLS